MLKKSPKDFEKQLDEIRVSAIRDFNQRRAFRIQLREKKSSIVSLGKRVQEKLLAHQATATKILPKIGSNLQYGLANTELEDTASGGQGLVLVSMAVNYMDSLVISPELFEHLLLSEKETLKPFVKRPLSRLISQGVVRSIRVPNSESMYFFINHKICIVFQKHL